MRIFVRMVSNGSGLQSGSSNTHFFGMVAESQAKQPKRGSSQQRALELSKAEGLQAGAGEVRLKTLARGDVTEFKKELRLQIAEVTGLLLGRMRDEYKAIPLGSVMIASGIMIDKLRDLDATMAGPATRQTVVVKGLNRADAMSFIQGKGLGVGEGNRPPDPTSVAAIAHQPGPITVELVNETAGPVAH